MALAMLVGGCQHAELVALLPANTLAALLANNFSESAVSPRQLSVLMYAALVLMAITLLINMLVCWCCGGRRASSKESNNGAGAD